MERRSFFGWLASGILSVLSWSKNKPAEAELASTPEKVVPVAPAKVPCYAIEVNLPSGKGKFLAETIQVVQPTDGAGDSKLLIHRLIGTQNDMVELYCQSARVDKAFASGNEWVIRSTDKDNPNEFKLYALFTFIGYSAMAGEMSIAEGVEMHTRTC